MREAGTICASLGTSNVGNRWGFLRSSNPRLSSETSFPIRSLNIRMHTFSNGKFMDISGRPQKNENPASLDLAGSRRNGSQIDRYSEGVTKLATNALRLS